MEQGTAEWVGDGVKVFVPVQKSGIMIEIRPRIYGNPPDIQFDKEGDFRIIRRLINFEIVLAGTAAPVKKFDPPAQLQVCISEDDIAQAGELNKLVLGWYDYEKNVWHVLIRDINPEILDQEGCPYPGYFGAITIDIEGIWADPPMAWGT